jgi:hypothetical protein
MYSHVINDVVANVPVTVTYCDKTDCARVFTDESRGQPLEIDLGGFDRGMLLRFDGDFYRQQEGVTIRPNADDRFPFPTLPFERMTWLVWKKRHPNSRVFKGVAPVPDTHRARPEEAGD